MRWNIHNVSARLFRLAREHALADKLKQPKIYVPAALILLAATFLATWKRPKLYVEAPSPNTSGPATRPISAPGRPSIQLTEEEKRLAGQSAAPARVNALAVGGAYPLQITYTCPQNRVRFSALVYPTDPSATVGATIGGLRVAKADTVVTPKGNGIYEWEFRRESIPAGGAQLNVYTLVVNPNSPNRQANRDQTWRFDLPGDICT